MLAELQSLLLAVDEERRGLALAVGGDQRDAADRRLARGQDSRRAAVDHHDRLAVGKQPDNAHVGRPCGDRQQKNQNRYNAHQQRIDRNVKPVAIFRHSPTEGPGYFATFLDAHRIPWRLIKVDAGEPVPASPADFSGLVFMGGPMSVNDDLPWIPDVVALINSSAQADIPVLGHCLGGQLMSKALGGTVTRNGVKEIGWGKVAVTDGAQARDWFGATREFNGFHWHGETFTRRQGIRCASRNVAK